MPILALMTNTNEENTMATTTETLYTMTADARFFFPTVGPSILVRLDTRHCGRGHYEFTMAPIGVDGAAIWADRFTCSSDDVKTYQA